VSANVSVDGDLVLASSVFEHEVELLRAAVAGAANITGSILTARFSLNSAQLAGDLFLDRDRFEEAVDLIGVNVGGSVILDQAV
jgi:hypothetical protein